MPPLPSPAVLALLGLPVLGACAAPQPPAEPERVIVVLPPPPDRPVPLPAAIMPGTDGGISTDGPMPAP